MSCINRNHVEIIKMAEELNVSPAVLAGEMGAYMSQNNIEDRFPTIEEMVETGKFAKTETIYDKLESKLDESVESIFSEDYKPSIFNKEVSEPAAKTKFESRIMFNNKSGKFTVDEVLENILNNYDELSPIGRQLLEKSRRLIGRTGTKLQFVSESVLTDKFTVMQIDSDTNTIQLNRNRLERYSTEDVVESFIHEIAHGQSLQALLNPQSFDEHQFKDLVEKYYTHYKSKTDSKSYGFDNVKEFVAEIYASEAFREELRQLDINSNTSYWNKFIDAVRRLFGMSKSKESDMLIDEVIDFIEKDRRDYRGMNLQRRLIFAKKVDYKQVELVTLTDRLNDVVNRAKDRMEQAYNRAKSNTKVSKDDKKKNLEGIQSLISEMESYSGIQNWKSVVAYTTSLSNLVGSLKRKFDAKDREDDNFLETIYNFENYLLAYDLLPEIKKLLAESESEINDPEVQKDINAIDALLRGFEYDHNKLLNSFQTAKENRAKVELSNAEYSNEVETKNRLRLEKEYKDLKITGESRNEYVVRIMNTRDRLKIQKELLEYGEKLAKNPTMDISSFLATVADNLNLNSKLIDVVMKMANEVRDKIVQQFNARDKQFGKLFDSFIKEKGSNPPSKLYNNQYEKSKDGTHYLVGNYKIEFYDKYKEEYQSILAEKFALIKSYKEQGLKSKEFSKLQEFKDVVAKEVAWKKVNTKPDGKSKRNFIPADKYKHAPLTGMDLTLNTEFRNITKESEKDTGGKSSLIKRINGGGKMIMFYKLPAHSKSDIERRMELDVKGLTKDKWTDFTKIKTDDIGYQAVDTQGNVLKGVRVHYRGKIESKEQSLDLMTMYRLEYLNGLNYREKSKQVLKAQLIADVAKGKQYYKKANGSNIPLFNIFAKNEPAVLFDGVNSNEYKKILGIIDSNFYDITSEIAPKINGADLGKMTGAVSGFTAQISMIFNIASGAANITNGTTQLFIEAMGGNFINKASLAKAEALYFKNLPQTLADLSNPVKTSFNNQMLRMFDIVGGFSPGDQAFIKNTMLKKLGSTESLNAFNESGEHLMNSVLTMGVLDTLKVMNSDYKFIDKNGKVVEESKAASLLDMLSMNSEGNLEMNPLVAFTNKNMITEYHKGGKTDINDVIKKKGHDLYGAYDARMQNELYKQWYGKAIMMFKKFFGPGLQYRWKGISKSLTSKDELTDDDLNYNAFNKEYEEGTYVSMIRFLRHGVIPALKQLSLTHSSDYYNSLSDFEKANLKKVTTELLITGVLLPLAGMMLAGAAGDDDDLTWFLIYQNSRLSSELRQFYNPIEAARITTNPVAGMRTVQNGLGLMYEIMTPFNFVPDDDEYFFSYLDENSKGDNKLLKRAKKMTPIWSQFDRDWKQMNNFLEKGR